MRVLLVSNDFPPRVGGIQSYLWKIYSALPARGIDVRVLAPRFEGDASFDEAASLDVHRWPRAIAWPTPDLKRALAAHARDADVVAFGAVLPMNLLASSIDRPVVVHTHGFEVAWARVSPLRQALRRIGARADIVTVVSDYTRTFIERALPPGARVEMLRTGVDLERFRPGIDTTGVRARHALGAAKVISCVSRLVPRKGQDQLIRALPIVRREHGDVRLLLAGRGPYRARLGTLAERHGVSGVVSFAGEVSEDDLAAHYAAGDVFAMPCRSRYADLEVEGLGLVYLEAQACARPAITGDSGGAPEAVLAGRTGAVVPGRDHVALARALGELLGDPERMRAMGDAGRAFVEARHGWDDVVSRFEAMLRSIV